MSWNVKTGPESGMIRFHCTVTGIYFGPAFQSVEEGEAFAATLEKDPRALKASVLSERYAAFRAQRAGMSEIKAKLADHNTRAEQWARDWCRRNGLDPERWGSYRLPWPTEITEEHHALLEELNAAVLAPST